MAHARFYQQKPQTDFDEKALQQIENYNEWKGVARVHTPEQPRKQNYDELTEKQKRMVDDYKAWEGITPRK